MNAMIDSVTVLSVMGANIIAHIVGTAQRLIEDSIDLADDVIDSMGFRREPCEMRKLSAQSRG